jgi:hypothetical protein
MRGASLARRPLARVVAAPRSSASRARRPRPRAATATADDVDRCALVCAIKECKRKGALRTLETLTRRASELELGVAVRVQTTRCQSECADGPNVKLLPEGRVLNGVRTTAEADEALERCATYAPE